MTADILADAKEVIKLYTADQVNKWLSKGWKLVYVGQYTDSPHEYGTEFVLIRTE